MPKRKLPIQGGAYKNIDEVSLTRNSPALIDGYPNEAGSTVKRPGLSLWLDLNVPQIPIDGLYWWDKQKCIIAVCGKRVYRINEDKTKIDITGAEMEQTGLTRIDDNGPSIYLANGKRIMAYDVAGMLSTPLMTGSGSDDLTANGTPTSAKSFKVVIDSVGASDTFKWSDDGGVNYNATLVTITGAAQALSAGISITFSSATGHTLDDFWYFYTTQTNTYLLPNRNAPDEVSHVGIHDSYLICNKLNTGEFHFSEVASTPIFRALNFATAESNPDDIVALHIAWREIALFGRKSIEVWFDDGQTPFSRLEGAFTERGCSAAYSVQFLDNTWMWLDNARRFSKMQGRSPVIVSTPYDKVIQALTRVDDAYSEVIEVNGRTFYVCTFPTDKFTVCYDWAANEWTQWARWNQLIAEYEHFVGRCHAYSPDWGLHLIGDRTTSKIYVMDAQYHTDAGETIRTTRRTGHVDHGTGNKKLCKGLRVKILRGAGDDSGSVPKMVVRWRNDNGLWGQDHEVSLGAQGDSTFYGTLGHGRSLGTYRARQWEFVHTDDSSFILVEAEEDFEVLSQ